ncbi:MAG: sulfatase-like hydrolase/transferase [Pirellulaceae bacterium]
MFNRAICLLGLFGGLLLVAPSPAWTAEQATKTKPNLVILLADDLGYADVGFHGSKIRTPHIDSLAKDGARLERFYSCPMCSPTRAGLMTGRWPLRMGIMRAVIPPWRDYGLPESEHTLAEMLAEAGYRHRAVIGKWHLGHAHRRHHPLNHGFTHFYGHYNGAIDYFTHEREGEVDWHRDHETVLEEGYSTDLLGSEAARFIDGVPKGEPYFLYLPFNAPHSPFQAKQEELARYAGRRGNRKTLAAMIDSLDQAVGKVLGAIERRGDAHNTFVLFFSDNGGVRTVADNSPLRGSKLTPYEGGIRVVAAARYPAGGVVGGKVSEQRMGYIDVYPTLKHLAGGEGEAPNPLDGRDVLDAMAGREALSDRPWFTYEAQSGDGGERLAVNTDGWKLVVHGPSVLDESKAAAETRRIELFRIDRDPHEKNDMAAEHADRVAALLAQAREFRRWQVPGVAAYAAGREGFTAPPKWRLPD